MSQYGGVLVVMGILSWGSAFGGTKEATFWNWFQKNSDALFHFERDQDRVFDQLAEQMHRVDEDLTFEFGPVREHGIREFVISAGGIKRAFPAVESLYAAAPRLPNWTWIKFRPRRDSLSDIQMSGKQLSVSDVRYKLYRDGEKTGIVLFIDGYEDSDRSFFGQAGFLMLDEALGEYTMETQVGFVEFAASSDDKAAGAAPMPELAAHFDEARRGRVQ